MMHRRALIGETVTYANEWRNKHLVTTVCPHRSNGVIVGAIGTCVDMTTQYMLERRMVDAQRAESLGVLAGGLAHDFNNLLVAILGNADLALRETGSRGPGRAPLENIQQASLRAAELIDQLLAYAGHRGVASTRVSPSPVIEELIRITAPTMPRNIELRVEIASDLVLRGDVSQIRQVLLNLMNNARDALGARGGTIAITGRLLRHDGAAHADDVIAAPAGTYVELEVADDGPGMSSETRRRIFEPFFTTKSTGHGLGLAAVAGIVRAHGGGLRLAHRAGRGRAVPGPVAVDVHAERAHRGAAARQRPHRADHRRRGSRTRRRGPDDRGPRLRGDHRDRRAGRSGDHRQPADRRGAGRSHHAADERRRRDHARCARAGPTCRSCCAPGSTATAAAVRADAYLPKPFRIEALEGTLAKLLPPRTTPTHDPMHRVAARPARA